MLMTIVVTRHRRRLDLIVESLFDPTALLSSIAAPIGRRNTPAHRPILHHMATHSQLHSTSKYMGMMWGFLKKNPTHRQMMAAQLTTMAVQSTRLLSAYATRI